MDVFSASAPSVERRCSRKQCHKLLASDWDYKQCSVCQNSNRRCKKRKRDKEDEGDRGLVGSSTNAPEDGAAGFRPPNETDDEVDDERDSGAAKIYRDREDLVTAIRDLFVAQTHIHFYGTYKIAADPLVSMKESVRMLAYEVWKVTTYRFFVRDHKSSNSHHKTRYWCCQDVARKQKPHTSTKDDAKRRENVGMQRFPCNSRLNITCRSDAAGNTVISLRLVHEARHVAYYDVSMPEGALDMVRTHMDFSTPSVLASTIREKYPQVSGAQVHRAWSAMSETMWKRASDQMESGRILLRELGAEVDYFDDIQVPQGVEQLCFGMKRILNALRGKVVEIGMDATYNTNKGHLELYSIMGEFDNAGFPLAYCLLTTATAVAQGKRTSALEAWATVLRDRYGISPKFIHLDKDMAEIGMAKRVWALAKILVCWWHLNRAASQRLANEKLSTTPYRAKAAHECFPFIDLAFIPSGDPDAAEREGGPDPNEMPRETDVDLTRPWALKIKLRPNADGSANKENLPPHEPPVDSGPLSSGSGPIPGGTKPRSNLGNSSANDMRERNAAHIIPPAVISDPLLNDTNPGGSLPKTEKQRGRVFCPKEHRGEITGMMERHYCAHQLIPGEAHPSKAAIYEWAVRMMYEYCVSLDLREVWAYLWENWYRPGRWELWARSTCPDMIAILKTTMILESHWRRIKEDFLHHFAMPRVDLLIWVLVTKLAPNYYRRLDVLMNPIGRYRELGSWRKAFKKEWRRCETTPLTLPINEKYQPSTERWAVHPVPPVFFLEVTRNRAPPFWSHPYLISLDGPSPATTNEANNTRATVICGRNEESDSDDEDVRAFTATQATFREQTSARVELIREFANILEYQAQFGDQRMLDSLEREGSRFFRLVESCCSRERRFRSGTEASPTTWEVSTANAMFFRARPEPDT